MGAYASVDFGAVRGRYAVSGLVLTMSQNVATWLLEARSIEVSVFISVCRLERSRHDIRRHSLIKASDGGATKHWAREMLGGRQRKRKMDWRELPYLELLGDVSVKVWVACFASFAVVHRTGGGKENFSSHLKAASISSFRARAQSF